MMRIFAVLGAVILMGGPVFADASSDALRLINGYRAQAGCRPLVVNPQLQAAAKNHAQAMASKNFFSHTGKTGSKMAQRIAREGFKGRKLAENIAAGQSSGAEVFKSWMSSQGHKRNLMDCDFSETGLAMVYQADDAPLKGNGAAFKYYWVQTFGTK
jgi:uncharacterized protein YkwD